MDITRQSIGELTERITLHITKEDYSANVEKTLKDYKRRANIPGFRPGKAPLPMIQRMYGKAVLLDELDKLINQHLNEYIKNEKLPLITDPIAAADVPPIDLDREDFEFSFDVGLKPDFSIAWPKKEKLLQYELIVTDDQVEKRIQAYARRLGTMVNVDEVTDDCTINGELLEIDANGQIVNKGIKVDNFTIYFSEIADDEIKNQLRGSKVGSVVQLNIKKLFDKEEELFARLGKHDKKKEELPDLFQLEIKSITQLKPHEINQAFYDKVYGEGKITSDEMFRDRLKDEMAREFSIELLRINIKELREFLIRSQKIQLPVDFLKRWVKSNDKDNLEDSTLELIYPRIEEDFKWYLIIDKISQDYNIEVKEDDVLAHAAEIAREHLDMVYGIKNVPEEQLRKYGKMLLKSEEDVRKMVTEVLEIRALDIAKQQVKVEVKQVNHEELFELIKQKL